MEKTMVKQVVPLKSMKYYDRADIDSAACGGTHNGAGT